MEPNSFLQENGFNCDSNIIQLMQLINQIERENYRLCRLKIYPFSYQSLTQVGALAEPARSA